MDIQVGAAIEQMRWFVKLKIKRFDVRTSYYELIVSIIIVEIIWFNNM